MIYNKQHDERDDDDDYDDDYDDDDDDDRAFRKILLYTGESLRPTLHRPSKGALGPIMRDPSTSLPNLADEAKQPANQSLPYLRSLDVSPVDLLTRNLEPIFHVRLDVAERAQKRANTTPDNLGPGATWYAVQMSLTGSHASHRISNVLCFCLSCGLFEQANVFTLVTETRFPGPALDGSGWIDGAMALDFRTVRLQRLEIF